MSDEEVTQTELDELNKRILAYEKQVQKLKREQVVTKELKKRNMMLEQEVLALSSFSERTGPPEWITRPPATFEKTAVACLLISDLHLDEHVYPEQLNGMNAYNRTIAQQRWNNVIEGFVDKIRSFDGYTYEGAVMPFIGDIFSGDIHEELKETNDDTLLGSVDFWIDPLAEGIQYVLQEFGQVHIPVVPGNHGRTTRKPRAKFRARSNFDWFIGAQLARVFKDDPRVTFDLADAADTRLEVFDSSIMFTHGDQATGGSGIGGIYPPIKRLDAKKRARQNAVNQGYDYLAMGHWHTLLFGDNFIINGTMKGYDEYAYTSNFGWELPSQAAWLMEPGYGRTLMTPIHCMDFVTEGWTFSG